MNKLEIGPSEDRKLGNDWLTINMVKTDTTDIVHDIRKLPLPFEDSRFEIVYMSHILEHIPWFQTHDLLLEINRILKKSGTLEVWVPDFKKIISGYLNNSLIKKDGWYKYNEEKNPMKWVNGRIFTYGPDEANWHRCVFDEEYLKECFKNADFINIKKLDKPRGYDHGWINLGVKGEKQ